MPRERKAMQQQNERTIAGNGSINPPLINLERVSMNACVVYHIDIVPWND